MDTIHGRTPDATCCVDPEAIEQPIGASGVAPAEPQGLKVGMSVEVNPDTDGGEQPVKGTLRYADAETISVDRVSEAAGNLCVHFPRAGYRVDIAS